ncbi:TIGR01212 family radical SAM protein [Petrocella sp. FN5]|uniref:TIGR01212 family radical SAM protein n=1 Tax=Petrocella sp. FN5 TaxID=3032002 RepID=UPI0023DC6051|nr:TIGR01212 family radical SAM protein [Petrocella sp. FN5]MDF1618542.1 TIGR01212 family radical SAM protein [Petrocella sp. FN5]
MIWPDQKPYYSLNCYYNQLFGQKTYKIALDIGLTCPNRDGTLDYRGCIFCSSSGSGDFATPSASTHEKQLDTAKGLLQKKYEGQHYIAYFQAFTNTYGPIDYLRTTYRSIIQRPDILGLSIATRPDCLSKDILDLLKELVQVKPVWVELGLQSIHEKTSSFIRRCYPLEVFDHAVQSLHAINIKVVVHLIAGLPTETDTEFLESVAYVNRSQVHGIKFQLLQVLRNTDLGSLYTEKPFRLLTLDGYANLIVTAIANINPNMVVHRITGDAPKEDLIAPLWSLNKRGVLNKIHQCFKDRELWQGKLLENNERRPEHDR